ncbi:MAG: S8 family serine peptidase [Candidatus Nanopelagicales bacterium]
MAKVRWCGPSVTGRVGLVGVGALLAALSGANSAAPAFAVPEAVGGVSAVADLGHSIVVEMADGQLPGRAEMAALADSLETRIAKVTPLGNDFARVEMASPRSAADLSAAAEALSDSPEVVSAQPDIQLRLAQAPPVTPNDPGFGGQWGLWDTAAAAGGAAVRAPVAWLATAGSPGVTVAVVDTGLTAHPDLPATQPGYDFVSQAGSSGDGDGRDADPADPGDACASAARSTWHGTHVAGIIAARTGNYSGVAGVAPAAWLLPVRVLGCGGAGVASDIADGITWAAGGAVPGVLANAHPAQVINLSVSGGYPVCPAVLAEAISGAIARGANVVAAAGNSGGDVAGSTPANCPGVISVAATNRAGARAGYSSYGSAVSIAAPGGESGAGIWSTFNSGTQSPGEASYAFDWGTSMAAGFVSGVLALVRSAHPDWSAQQVWLRLAATAAPFASGTGRDCTRATCGAGVVDAGAALFPRTGAAGSLAGVIRDQAGAAVADVPVSAIDQATGDTTQTTNTAADGSYVLGGLAPGVYAVRVDPSRYGLAAQFRPQSAQFSPAGAVALGAGAALTGLDDVLAGLLPAAPEQSATTPDPVPTESAPAAVALPEPAIPTASPESPAPPIPSVVVLTARPRGKTKLGNVVTLTARVSPAQAGVSVVFRDGGHTLGTAQVHSGVAVLATKGIYGGKQTVTGQLVAAAGYSQAGASVALQVKDTTAPVFRILKFAATASGPSIKWVATDSGGVARVAIQSRAGWSGPWRPVTEIAGASAQGWTAKSLAAGSTACYRLRAVDFAGNRSKWKTICGLVR